MLQAVGVVDPLVLTEAADARMERWHLGRPAPRVGADLHDLPVAHVGVDDAAPAAVVAAGAGDDGFARLGRDTRSFVDGSGSIHANNPTKFRAKAERLRRGARRDEDGARDRLRRPVRAESAGPLADLIAFHRRLVEGEPESRLLWHDELAALDGRRLLVEI